MQFSSSRLECRNEYGSDYDGKLPENGRIQRYGKA